MWKLRSLVFAFIRSCLLPGDTAERPSFNMALRHLFFQGSEEFCKCKYKRADPGVSAVKNPRSNAGGVGSTPGPGRARMPRDSEARVPQALRPSTRARGPQVRSPWALAAEARRPHSPCSATKVPAVRSSQTTAGVQPLLSTTRETAEP